MRSHISLANVHAAIYNSPFGHGGRVCNLMQNLTDLSNIPHEQTEMKRYIYRHIFDDNHPKTFLLQRFDQSFRSRWCKPGCLNNPKPRALSEKAIRKLGWLSGLVPPRVHAANIRLHLNAWHTNRRYQKKCVTPCYFCARPVQDSLEHIFCCEAVQSVFPSNWRGNVAKCFFLAGSQDDEVLLASLLVYGVYSFHCAARHSSTPTYVEVKASILRLIGEIPLSKRVSGVWYQYLRSW